MNSICVINGHRNKTGQVGDAIKNCRIQCYPTNKKRKEKETDLEMTNMCSINQISLLTILNTLLSYRETWFAMLTLVLTDYQFYRKPAP